MTYADGSTTIVPTMGGEWKVGESGTITNNIYLGERFDFRKASPPSWAAAADFDDSAWPAAATYASAAALGDGSDERVPGDETSSGGDRDGSFFCGECGPNKAPNPGMTRYQTLTLECPGSTIAAVTFARATAY